MNTENKSIKIETKEEIGIIILNMPETMNALNTGMLQDMEGINVFLEKRNPKFKAIDF
jgi:enoyl-CoA hydratase/carnithine racemase